MTSRILMGFFLFILVIAAIAVTQLSSVVNSMEQQANQNITAPLAATRK